jgi:uncharacterized protein YcgI (DUF1989 family)
VINLFQVTGLMPDDKRYFMKTCPAQPGDHVELLAETDLLMAISLCPGGDLAVPLWGEGSDAEPNCNPLRVQVFELGADVRDEIARLGWGPSERATYAGVHGTRHGLVQPAGVPPSLADRSAAH